jgi:hypothetical protein
MVTGRPQRRSALGPALCEIEDCGISAVRRCTKCERAFCLTHQAPRDAYQVPYEPNECRACYDARTAAVEEVWNRWTSESSASRCPKVAPEASGPNYISAEEVAAKEEARKQQRELHERLADAEASAECLRILEKALPELRRSAYRSAVAVELGKTRFRAAIVTHGWLIGEVVPRRRSLEPSTSGVDYEETATSYVLTADGYLLASRADRRNDVWVYVSSRRARKNAKLAQLRKQRHTRYSGLGQVLSSPQALQNKLRRLGAQI